MEKILLALDQRTINMNVVEFACFVSRLTRSELTVIFLRDSAEGAPVESEGAIHDTANHAAVLEKTPVTTTGQDNISLFESACQNRGTRIRVLQHDDEPLPALISESRFADLLIVDPEMYFGDRREPAPTHFIKEVLAHSECPVAIAPYTFNDIEEIVFAYDGSASATFAIKQFCYLFPELADLRLTILQVSDEKHDPEHEKKKVIDFLQMHYSSIGYRILKGKASDELFRFLHDKKNVFLVMGAYSHKNLASFFRHRTADLLLKTANLPIFIAHKD